MKKLIANLVLRGLSLGRRPSKNGAKTLRKDKNDVSEYEDHLKKRCGCFPWSEEFSFVVTFLWQTNERGERLSAHISDHVTGVWRDDCTI